MTFFWRTHMFPDHHATVSPARRAATRAVPKGHAVWICGDCHAGNPSPLAAPDGKVDARIRDLDQTVIGNPHHELIRLALLLCSAARGSNLPGVTTATASLGYSVYSALLHNWVYVSSNIAILSTAVVGEVIYLRNSHAATREMHGSPAAKSAQPAIDSRQPECGVARAQETSDDALSMNDSSSSGSIGFRRNSFATS